VRFWQLFFSYFKELVGKEVTVELKNDLAITGILHSVDQYLNIKLENTRVVDEAKYPHMVFPPTSLSLSLSLSESPGIMFLPCLLLLCM
jgi:U6 snRNA-associated Sm-like protein LSm2